MRPAFSILFFTTLSGAGYGIWTLLGFALACGLAGDSSPVAALAMLATGFVLTTAGLLFSVAHLGQPQRAWRALSQWRSSWLSREGIAALVCVAVAGGLAAAILCALPAWVVRIGGGLLAACALLVVYCTARIYTSLPTIAAWHNRHVLPVYLLLGVASGGAWSWLLALVLADGAVARAFTSAPALLALAGVFVVAFACKWMHWRYVDGSQRRESTGSATGLDRCGEVQGFEHPHTEANYLTHEMGFVLARKHSARLRAGVCWLAFAAPVALLLAGVFAPRSAPFAAPVAVFAVMLGVFVERWLFFAEARHVVSLYYGARDAA